MEKAGMSILIQIDCCPSGTQDCRMQHETCEIVFQIREVPPLRKLRVHYHLRCGAVQYVVLSWWCRCGRSLRPQDNLH